jgi:hypothetical protein
MRPASNESTGRSRLPEKRETCCTSSRTGSSGTSSIRPISRSTSARFSRIGATRVRRVTAVPAVMAPPL